ncbi:MAG: PaaX family transcriptional regulator C-terminal domain-containing protein [Candidatus Nanopelagicales bacterium]
MTSGAPGLPPVDLRPQSVLLTLFGDYVDGEGQYVAARGVLDLLDTAGVGEHATRATLNRMVKRGLLARQAIGRQAYFGLTAFGRRTVLDGRERAHLSELVDAGWDGRWTLVSFSMPEDASKQRHELRSRLLWAGFGMVQPGLWAAPRSVDVADLIADLDGREHVDVFSGAPQAPSDGAEMLRRAFDLDALAARYDEFATRWSRLARAGARRTKDPLACRVVLSTDWLQVIREDPRLPLEFLDPRWPALEAGRLYRSFDEDLRPLAEEQAAERLDVVVG